MRRLGILLLLCAVVWVPMVGAQDSSTYQNDELGVAFTPPADWEVQAEADTITVAAPDALATLEQGAVPDSLVVRIIIGTFLDMDIQNASQLPEKLSALVPSGVTAPEPQAVTYGNVQGWEIEYAVPDGNLTSRVALLGLPAGRIALVRGFSSTAAWSEQVTDFEALTQSLAFTLPAAFANPFANIPDNDGGVFWHYQAAQPADVPTVTLGGITYDPFLLMYVAAGERGILVLDETNGAFINYLGPFFDDDNFIDIAISADARLFVANATAGDNNHIMVVNRAGAFEYGFGSTGDEPGQFAPGMPRTLAIEGGRSANIWTISEGHSTPPARRLYKFDRFGTFITMIDLDTINPELSNVKIDNNVGTGGLFLVGETGGLNLLDFNAQPLATNLGMEIFSEDAPVDVAIAPNDNIIVATQQNGFLEFSPSGALLDRFGIKYPEDRTDRSQPGEFYQAGGLVVNVDGNIFFAETNPLSGFSQVQNFGFSGDGNLPLPNRAESSQAVAADAPALDPALGGGAIEYGAVIQGALNNQFPAHDYTFEGQAGDRIRITMRDLSGTGELDTQLTLTGPSLLEIGFNDDAETPPDGFIGTDSVIEIEIQALGTYTIQAGRFGGRGNYELTLERLSP